MKTLKEKIEIMQACLDGAEIESRVVGDNEWSNQHNPHFHWSTIDYRIKQTPDSIDWSHVADEFKFMARDKDGKAFVYSTEPVKNTGHNWWECDSESTSAATYKSYKQGTVSWDNSLVERPE